MSKYANCRASRPGRHLDAIRCAGTGRESTKQEANRFLIRVTEFNFPGQRSKYYGKRGVRLSDEEEKAKAKALTEYFRICFAYPAVHGILLWGFWEGNRCRSPTGRHHKTGLAELTVTMLSGSGSTRALACSDRRPAGRIGVEFGN